MRSLRTRISLSILLTLLISIALIGLLSNVFINREFAKYIIEQERMKSENIVSDLSRRDWSQDFLHTIGMHSLHDGHVLKIFDSNGEVAWDAEDHNCWHVMEEIATHKKHWSTKKNESLVTQSYDIMRDGHKLGSVSITCHDSHFLSKSDFSFIRALNIILFAIGILAGIFSIAVGYILARRISQPVIETANAVKQIEQGNYDVCLAHVNTRELNDLAMTISRLAKALSQQENWRKLVTSNVAHDLRTPLTIIGLHLEAMSDGMWEATPERLKNCHSEVLRFGKLVADLERKLLDRPALNALPCPQRQNEHETTC
ncbi:MAG: hypothetical protein FWH22_01945 [Fibromonadales bacterium]|nr:hypothetical protein [Fibromonadales bacterium]